MEAKKLLEALSVAERLKSINRHCYTSEGERESVADHSWRIAVMAMLLTDEFPDVDMNKVIKMCLIHDMGEAFTGDIPVFNKTKEDEDREYDRLMSWVEEFPEVIREEWKALYREMDELITTEAKIYKALDKLEAVIQHNESDIGTWLPLEYDLQLEYGWENVEFSKYLTELRKLIAEETRKKIKTSKERGLI